MPFCLKNKDKSKNNVNYSTTKCILLKHWKKISKKYYWIITYLFCHIDVNSILLLLLLYRNMHLKCTRVCTTWSNTVWLPGTKTKYILYLNIIICTNRSSCNQSRKYTATIIDFVSISFTWNELLVPCKTNKRMRIIYFDRCTEYKYLLIIFNRYLYCEIDDFFLFVPLHQMHTRLHYKARKPWQKISNYYQHLHNNLNNISYINIYDNIIIFEIKIELI